jgi:hypothetical protein
MILTTKTGGQPDGTVVRVVILLGLLTGLLIGAAVCARYLRQEIAANIGPRLGRIEQQLDALPAELNTLRAELNLATEIRLAALSKRIDQEKQDK